MDLISIIFIIIIIISIIACASQGFIKTILGIAKSIVALVISGILSIPFADFFMKENFIKEQVNSFSSFLKNSNEVFAAFIPQDNRDGAIELALAQLNIPDFLNSFLTEQLRIVDISIYPTFGDVIAFYLVRLLAIVISFFIIYALIRLVLFIIDRLLSSTKKVKVVNGLDHFFGIFAGAIVGVFFIFSLCTIYIAVSHLPFLQSFCEYVDAQLKLGTSEVTFAKYMYENNLLLYLLSYFGIS